MRARDREDRFAGEYRRGSLFFCALFGFIFAAYRRTAVPPIDFPMSSVRGLKGVESEGKRERERGVQADRKRGEGGRSRSKGRLVIPRVPPANSNNRESSSIATGPSLTREANPK